MNEESVLEFLFWGSFGTGLFVLSLSSGATILGALNSITHALGLIGFTSGRDGLFVLAFLGLLLILFYTYLSAKTNRKHLYDLNQEVALLRYEQRQQAESQDEGGPNR